MKILPVEQNSLEWLQARAGVVTASEFDNLISPTWKIRDGETPKTYLNKKLAEWWLGGPLPGYCSIDMEFGHILEGEAKPAFTFEHGLSIQNVGFITTDDGKVGCSPDGLIGDDSGIEVKCPECHTHVKYLLAGTVPPEYLAQVHGSMYVTDRPKWNFFSYRRRFPNLRVEVQRDQKIDNAIHEALNQFLEKFEAAKERLIKINGRPPYRPAVQYQLKPQAAMCGDDIPA